MKTDRNILIAFLLNLLFAITELIGGALTGSVAIMSDAVHDAGDAASIGLAYVLERKSKQKANESYTYGYVRYSAIGGLITTIILIMGSIFVIANAIHRIISPVEINYGGMIWLAVAGVIINFVAAIFTKDGHSVNQKAVNLHMIEDVLGWVVVLIGAVVMNFTDWYILDPLMSIGVACYILMRAVMSLKDVMAILLEKAPQEFTVEHIKEHLSEIDDVKDVHHIHLWTIDGLHHCATLHVVSEHLEVKYQIKKALHHHGIVHATIEIEAPGENCYDKDCQIEPTMPHHHHHGHTH